MRILSLAALAAALIVPRAASAQLDHRVVPQNPERQTKLRRDRLDWNTRTLGGAYEKVGKKDARWDRPAREALDALARLFGRSTDPGTTFEDIFAPAKRAVDAGCDDPLVLYAYARSSVAGNYPGAAEYQRRLSAAAAAAGRSAYPVFRRAVALNAAGARLASVKEKTPESRAEAARLLDAGLDLLPQSFARDEPSPELEAVWLEVLLATVGRHRDLGTDLKAAYDRADSVLARVPTAKPLRLVFRGEFFVQYAWAARGVAVAADVNPGAWPTFEDRIAEARKALKAAWASRPGDTVAATDMLTVLKAVDADRAEMETWFTRAMAGDDDNEKACAAKLEWLDPKWHGSVEEMLVFGRACRDTKNWRAGLTLILPDAHYRAVLFKSHAEKNQYFRAPGVWDDVRSAYEEYLGYFPRHYTERGHYAVMCFWAGKFSESYTQFEAAGDNFTYSLAYPEAHVKQIRQYVTAATDRERHDAERAATPDLTKARTPAGFHPLGLAWRDPKGGAGELTYVKDCVTTAGGVEVFWNHDGVYLLRKAGEPATRVHKFNGEVVWIYNACDDGRYVWLPYGGGADPPHVVVIDPAAGKSWTFRAADGLPVAVAAVPPGSSLQLFSVAPVAPGTVCLTGAVDLLRGRGPRGSWIATLTLDPKGGKSVRVFHKADETGPTAGPDAWKKTTRAFEPRGLVALPSPGGGAGGAVRLVLLRTGPRDVHRDFVAHPLIIDPVAETVVASPAAMEDGLRVQPSPGTFAVHQGRFCWLDRPTPGGPASLFSFGLPDLRRKVLIGGVENGAHMFLIVGDRVHFVGNRWSVASLSGDAPRPTALKLPWVGHSKLMGTGLFLSRHLGILVTEEVSGAPTSRVTLRVDVPAAAAPNRSDDSEPRPSPDPRDRRASLPDRSAPVGLLARRVVPGMTGGVDNGSPALHAPEAGTGGR